MNEGEVDCGGGMEEVGRRGRRRRAVSDGNAVPIANFHFQLWSFLQFWGEAREREEGV